MPAATEIDALSVVDARPFWGRVRGADGYHVFGWVGVGVWGVTPSARGR